VRTLFFPPGIFLFFINKKATDKKNQLAKSTQSVETLYLSFSSVSPSLYNSPVKSRNIRWAYAFFQLLRFFHSSALPPHWFFIGVVHCSLIEDSYRERGRFTFFSSFYFLILHGTNPCVNSIAI
jgi:hypothetical protein